VKDTWKEYLSFNKRQRSGLLVLLLFITAFIIYLLLSDYFPLTSKPADFTEFKSELEKAGIKISPEEVKSKVSGHLTDINSADTNTLMTLPEMTSYCAGMIVRYRKKLGGYYSTKQLTEVWGMDSAMFKAIITKVYADTGMLHKIDINTADLKQLAYHPYIKYYLAKAIINYREEHGLFTSVSSLHQMAAIDDSTYSRIAPYFTVGNR
jgi:DNA uptake protein ComE-like DNA-binding protein